ncbi:MAG: hypothetical protein K5888_10545 [Lachnospiraceae bacterium]|nr:hypothetical protein [Lachnospiraceae bacterium]
MAKYDHVVIINPDAIKKTGALFECEYKFDSEKYRIEIYQKGVIIHGFRKYKSDTWNFDVNMRTSHDAFRKAYILYALCTGKGLEIEKINILCDGALIRSIQSKDDVAFPFIYSMLGNTSLIRDHDVIGSDGIFENKTIAKYLATSKRSDNQSDKKIVALYAFLLGRSREYEVDRFINFWTAINAIYGFLCQEHNTQVKKLITGIPKEKLEEVDVTVEELKELLTPTLAKKDMLQIKIFSKTLKNIYNTGRYKLNNDIDHILNEFNNDYHDVYRHFAEKYVDPEGRLRFKYTEMYSLVMGESTTTDPDLIKELDYLDKWASKMGISTHALLTIYEPYYMRNYYIHGNETQTLISDNYHLNMLSCLNYFMDRVLCDFIPALFNENKLKELLSIVHGIIYDQQKGDKKEIDKKAKKLAQKVKKGQWIIGKEL